MSKVGYIVIAVFVAFLGCILSQWLIPPGHPREIAQVLSVVAGFLLGWGGPRYLGV